MSYTLDISDSTSICAISLQFLHVCKCHLSFFFECSHEDRIRTQYIPHLIIRARATMNAFRRATSTFESECVSRVQNTINDTLESTQQRYEVTHEPGSEVCQILVYACSPQQQCIIREKLVQLPYVNSVLKLEETTVVSVHLNHPKLIEARRSWQLGCIYVLFGVVLLTILLVAL